MGQTSELEKPKPSEGTLSFWDPDKQEGLVELKGGMGMARLTLATFNRAGGSRPPSVGMGLACTVSKVPEGLEVTKINEIRRKRRS